MQHPVIKEYTRTAASYDKRWRFYAETTAKETLERAHLKLKKAETVLDLGCGTGILLDYLKKKCPAAQLSGVDPVKKMLDMARQKLPSSVDLREGWAAQIPFSDHQFDVVVSCSVFHYIRNPKTALREIRRVLRAHGSLIVTDWCNDFFSIRLTDLILRCFNQAHVRSYSIKGIKHLLEENDFTIINIDRYRISPWWGMMTIQATV